METLTIIALICGRFCAITRKKENEKQQNTCVEKNVSVFNNLRSCPRGRYL